jgi:hypothetical protein
MLEGVLETDFFVELIAIRYFCPVALKSRQNWRQLREIGGLKEFES